MRRLVTFTLAAGALMALGLGLTSEARAIPGLPVAVVGSGCRMGSTPTVDPEGVTVYCARIQYTDGYMWSRVPDVVPVDLSKVDQGSTNPIHICAVQTGWTLYACEESIANASYRGDGLEQSYG